MKILSKTRLPYSAVCLLSAAAVTLNCTNSTTIKGIKSGKAADEDEIRPEMLKALTGEGILWLTRVCQVAWKLGKTPRDWQTGVIIPIFKKGDRKQ